MSTTRKKRKCNCKEDVNYYNSELKNQFKNYKGSSQIVTWFLENLI